MNSGGWGNNHLLEFSGQTGPGLLDDYTRNQLMALGFTLDEMNVYDTILYECGKVTSQLMARYGIPYNEVQRIKYMTDIIMGKYVINTEDALIQHLKKMHLTNKKTGIYDLINSKNFNMKRKCLIAGMPAGTPFVLYNSGKEKKTHTVVNVTSSNIEFVSDIIPKLPYGDSKKLVRLMDRRNNKIKYYRTVEEIPSMYKENDLDYDIKVVAELEETDGKYIKVRMHRDYARMCGRYMIVASLRVPDNHLGMIKIITLDGARAYVYAKQTGWNEKAKYSAAKERIYDYGFDVNDIRGKLMQWGSQLYTKLMGVYADFEPATVAFEHLEPYIDRSVRSGVDDEYTNANDDNVAETSASSKTNEDDDW